MKKEYFLLAGLIWMFARLNLKSKFDDTIIKITKEHGNDTALIKALISVESSFNPDARNLTEREDSRGLGQINKDYAFSLGVIDLERLYDPAYNIEIMNKAIDDLEKRNKNILDLIASYNAGRVILLKGYYVNREYVIKVYTMYLLYKATGY